MIVHRHTEKSLIALTQKMPVPASVVIAELKQRNEQRRLAVTLQLTHAHGDRALGSNGDTVVVIIRDGLAITAMLRRSWDQSFSPAALRVDEVITWKEWARA